MPFFTFPVTSNCLKYQVTFEFCKADKSLALNASEVSSYKIVVRNETSYSKILKISVLLQLTGQFGKSSRQGFIGYLSVFWQVLVETDVYM